MSNIYERELQDGMYIEYIPSEHIWKVVENMRDETNIAVSNSFEKIGFGPIRRFVDKGKYKGNMTIAKINRIKAAINSKRMVNAKNNKQCRQEVEQQQTGYYK